MLIKQIILLSSFFSTVNFAMAIQSNAKILNNQTLPKIQKVQCMSSANQNIEARFLLDDENNTARYADEKWQPTNPIIGKNELTCTRYSGREENETTVVCVATHGRFNWELIFFPYDEPGAANSTFKSNYCNWECKATTYHCMTVAP